MAGFKFGKGTEEWMMFMDYWNLCQAYWVVEEADDYWEDFVKDMNVFHEKYKGVRLARFLALALINAQEEFYKERKNGKTK